MEKKRKIEIYLLILIILFGAFLRLYYLSYQPLWVDEATSSIASKMIVEKGKPILDSGAMYSRANFFHYFTAFFFLFGINDFTARLVSVIFGVLTILLGYFIGKEYSKTGGIVSALFFSVFFLEVFFSRQARFYQLFQFMFFLSMYMLYKSGDNSSKRKNFYLYISLLSFLIAFDSQIAGIVLAPVIFFYILIFSKKQKFLFIVPLAIMIYYFFPAAGLSSDSAATSVNYAKTYYSFSWNIKYLFILFIPGIFAGFLRKEKLTLLILLPSFMLLFLIFGLQTIALRYAYFFVFPLVLYSFLTMAFLYDKLGKLILITILILFIFPSNIFFPHTYVNVIVPIKYNYQYSDYTTPVTDYKYLSNIVKMKLSQENITIISLFSSDVEWYIRKPDYVIPFTMDGRGDDQISYKKENGEIVDIYSGSPIIDYSKKINKPYYVLEDSFSYSKLKPFQNTSYSKIIENCTTVHNTDDLKIYECV
ncbi:MAG: glycosyltransferase family 39 protein [Nanoarchaeota archaeon]|nr:glycosyltransferase family 39 protein [Nanoarchaeota archaeon]